MTDPGLATHAIFTWHDAAKRLQSLDVIERVAVDHVVDLLVAELRRRLGGPFTTDELANLYYDVGTGWCFDIAVKAAPGAPWAWDARVFDAAFARYVRDAADFAGGRRIDRDDE